MTKKTQLTIVMGLTFLRAPLMLLFFICAVWHTYQPEPWLFWFAFISMIAAAVTDLFDGIYARKWSVETTMGGYADPMMDKVFYLISLPLLIYLAGHNDNWTHAVILLIFTTIFLVRDQWVTFMRSLGAIYGKSGKANWSGKLRTFLTFPMVCTAYHYEAAPASASFVPSWFVYFFEGLCLAITILTIFVYTKDYWECLGKAMKLDGDAKKPPKEEN